MSNPNGRKGARWETRLAHFLKDNGFPLAERRVRGGSKDRGDISGIPFTVIEAKNESRLDLPRYLREAEVERANDGAELGIVCVPYKGHTVAQGYFVVTLETGVRMLRTITLGEPW